MSKLKVVLGLVALWFGVNFSPALAIANVMASPLLIWVVPLFLKSVPPWILVMMKVPISEPSTALREMTSPEVVCLLMVVVAGVTLGVSAIEWTLMLTMPSAELNDPSLTLYLNWSGPL